MIQNAETQSNVQAIERSLTKKDVIAILTQRLQDNLNSYYPDLDKNRTLITGKSLGGHVASTYRFEIKSGNSSKKYIIFLKLCPIFEALNPALMEYQTLQLLYHKMPLIQEDCHVPRPLDYFPDLHAYAMESVGTKNLREYLLKNNSRLRGDDSINELLDLVSGSANWLRAFHKITMSVKSIKFNYEAFIKSFVEEFDYRSLSNFRFPKSTVDRLEDTIKSLSSLNGVFDMPCAKWHWDYTPGHIFIDNNKISVIDILGLDNTPIYEDIGHFLSALTSINNLPFYLFFDFKRAKDRLCNQFINTYFHDTGYQKDEFVLLSNIYRLKYLIIYFSGQYKMISQKLHPLAGSAFANLRLVRLFNEPILQAIDEITKRIKKLI